MSVSGPQPIEARRGLVDELVERARDGRASIVSGPTGSGKSRVLERVHAALERDGIRSRLLLATASASTVPFGIFLPLLDVDALERVASADALGRALMLRLALLELHLRALLIDEAALLDPGAAALVLELAQGGVSVLVSTTTGIRPPDAVQVLERSPRTVHFTLAGLDASAVRILAEETLGAPLDEGAVLELTSVSAGRPGLAAALLREAVAAGVLVRADWLWRLRGALRPPRALQQAIGERLSALPEPEFDWITAVAIADEIADDLRPALASTTTLDRTSRGGWTAWDDLTRRHRIRQRSTAAAVDAAIGPHARRAARERLVEAYEQATRPLTDVEATALASWRLDLGMDLEPDVALRLGLLTTLSAPALSERLLLEGARLGDAEAPLALAEHLKRTGRVAEAQARLGEAVPMTDSDADRLAATLATVTGTVGRHSRSALAVLDAQLDAGGLGPESRAVRMCLLLCERRLPEAAAIAAAQPSPRRAEFVSVFIGMHEIQLHADRGEARQALKVVADLRAPAAATLDRSPEGPETIEWLTAWVHGVVTLDLDAAEEIAGREHRRTLDEGLRASRTQFAHMLGVIALHRGRSVEAVRLLAEADVLDGVWHDCWLPNILGSLATALVFAGRLDDAEQVVERLRGVQRCPQHEGALALADAELLAARGERAAAAAIVRRAAAVAEEQGATTEQFDCLVAAWRFGDTSAATALLAVAAPPQGRVRALQLDLAAASVDLDAGALQRTSGTLWAEGHRLLALEAMTAAARLDPGSAAGTVVARLLLRTPELRLASAEGLPTALTRREQAVARLAASGRADRQVAEELGISVRTAQTHLARAFAKLDIHRRAELADLV